MLDTLTPDSGHPGPRQQAPCPRTVSTQAPDPGHPAPRQRVPRPQTVSTQAPDTGHPAPRQWAPRPQTVGTQAPDSGHPGPVARKEKGPCGRAGGGERGSPSPGGHLSRESHTHDTAVGRPHVPQKWSNPPGELMGGVCSHSSPVRSHQHETEQRGANLGLLPFICIFMATAACTVPP